MRVVAFSGSPNMENGNTALILRPFLDGLIDGGAAVELFHTRKLDIQPCQGDFNCWRKIPGHCFQQDDMQMVHTKLRASDVWVMATPVYVWGVAGPLKNLMDRLMPLIEPFITLRDGHCSHPLRAGTPAAKLVLVSSCGFWEMDNFDPLLLQMRTLARTVGLDFAGALLRPHAPAFRMMLEANAPVRDVLDAAHAAGQQLATTGAISPETLHAISRPVVPMDEFRHFFNEQFRQELDHLDKDMVHA